MKVKFLIATAALAALTAAPASAQLLGGGGGGMLGGGLGGALGGAGGSLGGTLGGSGGVGLDGYLASDHVKLSVDAFDFSNVNSAFPRLRAQAQFQFLNRFYLGLGVDDILNTQAKFQQGRYLSGTDGFVGAGVTFSDDDVRAMLKAADAGKTPPPPPASP